MRSGELVGAGDAVEVRDAFLVGEGSKVGKFPRGVWRVETMTKLKRKRSHGNDRSGRKRSGDVRLARTANMWQRVVVVDVAKDGTERVGSSLARGLL